MNSMLKVFSIVVVCLISFSQHSYSASGTSPVIGCKDITAIQFEPNVSVISAKLVARNEDVPEHCRVEGIIWPELKYMVKLPTDWNNRFYMIGNGGSGSPIFEDNMTLALKRGYVTAGENTGHETPTGTDFSFAWPGEDNPHALVKSEQYNRTSVHLTTVLSKKIIRSYYGQDPRYNYFAGCSNGGRQGLIEAQHFPDDFDGLIVGAPVANTTKFTLSLTWEQQALLGDGSIDNNKLPALAKAVYDKCDSLDGLVDGLITDPRRCGFSAKSDLPQCKGNEDLANCFTKNQIEALARIFEGVNVQGANVKLEGQPLGASVMVPGPGGRPMSGWNPDVIPFEGMAASQSELFIKSALKYIAFAEPAGPAYNWKTFDFDTDTKKLGASTANAISPDLTVLEQFGGKIIHYHGLADAIMNPYQSTDYYKTVVEFMGDERTRDFYRLYMIPGMFHCRGGPGCDTIDWLSAIEKWVERGVAPETMIGRQVVAGESLRSRPHCLYPKVAQYTGDDDPESFDDARNFSCVEPGK